ncbi:hypothetical protein CI109_102384 [Kwoniella shandongensis]|uniref:Uncharacterized protein n=1 Tax=Kwoniella shandongensis TaxID=1734106 RepID=A0A5M6BZT6_9TREE|nr:uncharacterized protein CI109_003296 [Kwoniella shandongensis]KAA5528396.1 hypothetical protein CI109_003296 [Kwoniella shandongensis]
MKAPRRVPWSSHAELAELYDFLFSPSATRETRQRGLARMSIYISSPSCPSFIHLLHSLVAVELLPYPPRDAAEAQRTRMMMGMAIVRFVNGMVDPLQTGPYARPISHLAATLGLPPSLISLRHRATHEDLPPLPLLHLALAQSISYLHHNSFLPLLSASSSSSSSTALMFNENPLVAERSAAQRKRVDGLVKRWKKVMKSRLREKEVREEDESAREMRRVRKALEGEDGEVLVRVLAEVGGLVPIAARKRSTNKSTSPPTPSLKIWDPLLVHLSTTSLPSLPSSLASHILEILLNPTAAAVPSAALPTHDGLGLGFGGIQPAEAGSEEEIRSERESYRWGLGVWLLYIWGGEGGLVLEQEEKKGLYRKLLSGLLHLHEDQVLRRLHTSLVGIDPSLTGLSDLVAILPHPEEVAEEEEVELKGLEMDVDEKEAEKNEKDDEKLLQDMEQRLASFEHKLSANKPTPSKPAPASVQSSNEPSIPGWRRLTPQEWTPRPIGCPV